MLATLVPFQIAVPSKSAIARAAAEGERRPVGCTILSTIAVVAVKTRAGFEAAIILGAVERATL